MSLIANSPQARALARHVIGGALCQGPPPGWSVQTYRRRLRELARAGVLRPWEWTVDGGRFRPKSPAAGWLWLAGPRWPHYVAQAIRAEAVEEREVVDASLLLGAALERSRRAVCVEIVCRGTGKVVGIAKVRGNFAEEPDVLERAVNSGLDHDRFFTRLRYEEGT